MAGDEATVARRSPLSVAWLRLAAAGWRCFLAAVVMGRILAGGPAKTGLAARLCPDRRQPVSRGCLTRGVWATPALRWAQFLDRLPSPCGGAAGAQLFGRGRSIAVGWVGAAGGLAGMRLPRPAAPLLQHLWLGRPLHPGRRGLGAIGGTLSLGRPGHGQVWGTAARRFAMAHSDPVAITGAGTC